jgi:hypothetical protein
VQTADTRWETDNYRWSPWTAGEGIDAYIRRRRDAGWIYEGQENGEGATIVLLFKRRRDGSGAHDLGHGAA